jgi:pimeloyl-ACP methyl ester carboxylesterase
MLPGIESGAWQLERPVYGLRDAGVDQAIRIIEWGDRPLGSLSNLVSYERNLERARSIANEIADYQRCYPGRPVTLVGYSGGAGIAVLAAERLPENTQVDRLILLAAALSRQYDLRRAQERCSGAIINCYSHLDWFVLDLGTRLLGTIDRKMTTAAGKCGFDPARLPGRVQQVAWIPQWRRLGNDGGHAGWLGQVWSRELLARWIPPPYSSASGGLTRVKPPGVAGAGFTSPSNPPSSHRRIARSLSSRSAHPS